VSSFLKRLADAEVLMLATGPSSIRAVTHLDVSKEGIERAIEVLRQCVH
jgi:acetylornithine/succinyldiaminopimelate/putrescine aminotransferase